MPLFCFPPRGGLEWNHSLNFAGPTYEEVRQPSMNGFDVEKYQGRWYENAFHDWTQFTEVAHELSIMGD